MDNGAKVEPNGEQARHAFVQEGRSVAQGAEVGQRRVHDNLGLIDDLCFKREIVSVVYTNQC